MKSAVPQSVLACNPRCGAAALAASPSRPPGHYYYATVAQEASAKVRHCTTSPRADVGHDTAQSMHMCARRAVGVAMLTPVDWGLIGRYGHAHSESKPATAEATPVMISASAHGPVVGGRDKS